MFDIANGCPAVRVIAKQSRSDFFIDVPIRLIFLNPKFFFDNPAFGVQRFLIDCQKSTRSPISIRFVFALRLPVVEKHAQ